MCGIDALKLTKRPRRHAAPAAGSACLPGKFPMLASCRAGVRAVITNDGDLEPPRVEAPQIKERRFTR